MSITPINIGTAPNDGTGDNLRAAFAKVNANTQEQQAGLALKANQTALDAGLALKANQTALDAGLALKANQTALDAGLALKANQTALDAGLALKEPAFAAGTAAQYWRGDKTWQTLDKAAVGFANVDNTSDADKPVSTAQSAAIAASTANNIHEAAAKITPADADELGLSDSAASWGLKKLTFANLKAWLAGLFVSKSGATMTGNLTVPSINGGQLAGMRNKIINGSFSVNQRAYVSGAATTAGQYTFDRWEVTGTQDITFSTTNNKTTVTIPSGQTLQQVIEGLNLQSGTYVLSWEGTAQGRIGAGAYGASGTVTASITGGANTTIEFNAGTVTAVQLEPGTVATPFENRPYGLELALCQRYYEEVAYRVDTATASAANFGSVFIAYKATKRTLPTLSHKELNTTNCIFNSFQRTSVQGCTATYNTLNAAGFATSTLVAGAEL